MDNWLLIVIVAFLALCLVGAVLKGIQNNEQREYFARENRKAHEQDRSERP